MTGCVIPQTGAPAFQISPMNEPRYQAQQQQQQQQQPDGIPITEEPPKIKVVVRKRPINRKVGAMVLLSCCLAHNVVGSINRAIDRTAGA